MPDFVDSTVREIDARLVVLTEEVSRLQTARAALVGPQRRGRGRPRGSGSGSSAAPRRGPGPAGRRGPGRPPGRRGAKTRGTQALELVHSRPGITIPEIAETLKIEPNYLYRVMPPLIAEGKIKRDGHGWHPIGAQPGVDQPVEGQPTERVGRVS